MNRKHEKKTKMELVYLKKIVLTGGGTAGHVTPNIALTEKLKAEGYNISYIGSKKGMEKELIENINIKYYGISSGKLRRYFDFKNFTDMFNVLKGIFEASSVLKRISPDIVFSKGGFVTVPVIIAAKLNKIPVIIHESDITPGLANKIAIPFATYVCTSFPEALEHIPNNKGVLTGSPIRNELFTGDKNKGLELCGFKKNKAVILVMGGSLGSVKINNVLKEVLPKLMNKFQIVHICGKGNSDLSLNKLEGYKQFEYISRELPDLFAAADIIVSRAGANSIYEFLALRKPNLLIPLSKASSRGDQILNAESFKKQGFSEVLYEEELTKESLLQNIDDLFTKRENYVNTMTKSNISNGVNEIIKLIKKVSN